MSTKPYKAINLLNSVIVVCASGHRREIGSEKANVLARKKSNIGPKPMLGIPKNKTKADVKEGMK